MMRSRSLIDKFVVSRSIISSRDFLKPPEQELSYAKEFGAPSAVLDILQEIFVRYATCFRGLARRRTRNRWARVTCVYLSVERMELWPRNSCTILKSAPFSRRAVAAVCR